MIPFWTSDNGATTLEMYCGHVLDILAQLPAGAAHTVVTSPPYWGLRDYGLPPLLWGGDPACAHEWGAPTIRVVQPQRDNGPGPDGFGETRGLEPWRMGASLTASQGAFCRCGAWRGSLGLEPTPDLYVQHLVEVFRAVRRVLREDGTLWLNLGDSYGAGTSASRQQSPNPGVGANRPEAQNSVPRNGLKAKDLVGMPWRVAFALQADGWYLRSDIIWSKPNPMPESVTDRPTKAHEYLFLLARSDRYYYDALAIREDSLAPWNSAPMGRRPKFDDAALSPAERDRMRYWGNGTQHPDYDQTGRNKRTVWEIAPQPYPDAHFATFPEGLVIPCILAGCPDGGCVLDPFAGSGTTLLVAQRLGRHAIGIDLSEPYCRLAQARLEPIHAQIQLFPR